MISSRVASLLLAVDGESMTEITIARTDKRLFDLIALMANLLYSNN
jgi:hypothetical protein